MHLPRPAVTRLEFTIQPLDLPCSIFCDHLFAYELR